MSLQPSSQDSSGQMTSTQVLASIPEGRVRGLFSLLLIDQGCQVTACEDPSEAVRQAQTNDMALCIVQATEQDDQAPVIRAARSKNPTTRVLVVAEHACAERLPALFKLGVDELLYLPANARRCMELLRQLTMSPEPREALATLRNAGAPLKAPAPQNHRPAPGATTGLSASSPAMRSLLEHLRDVPGNAFGIILRGEPGSEFELLGREYHRLRGGEPGGIPTLSATSLDEDQLRDLIAMSRLSSEPVCTLQLRDLETLSASQQEGLRAILAEERKRRHRGKPLAFVFSFNLPATIEHSPLLEELLLHTPHSLLIPPLRERPEDLDSLARHLLGELSILHPKTQVRTLDAGAREWLRMQPWPGNHAQFVELIHKAVLSGPTRTMSAMTLARLSAEEVDTDSTH